MSEDRNNNGEGRRQVTVRAKKQEHTHTHADGTSHTHTHADGTSHTHGATEGSVSDEARTAALLNYMLEHNRSHADELSDMAAKLEAAEQDRAAEIIRAGVLDFSAGNDKLEEALRIIKAE